MPDIESILADVTYLSLLSTDSAGRISKKLVLPDLLQSFVTEKLILRDLKNEFIVQILTEKLGKELFIKFCETLTVPDLSQIVMFYHKIMVNDIDPNSAFPNNKMEPEKLYEFIDERITYIRAYLVSKRSDDCLIDSSKPLTSRKLSCTRSVSGRDKIAFSEINLNVVGASCEQGNSGETSNLKGAQSFLDFSNYRSSFTVNSGNNKIEAQKDTVETAVGGTSELKSEKTVISSEKRFSETDDKHHVQSLEYLISMNEVTTSNQNFLQEYAGFSFYDRFTDLATRIKIELIDHLKDSFFISKFYIRYLQWKGYQYHNNMTQSMFITQRIIGRGGYGEVYGCIKADTGYLYAIKIQDKKRIKKKCDERGVLTERALLTKLNFPFLISLVYAFQTTSKVIFIMDLLEGGDLRYNMSTKKEFMEEEIMFYAYQIILSIQYLHSKKIIFRDLKPANILLDAEGHTKLIDFGLATYCENMKKSRGAVGTYGYIAPEILKKTFYNHSVDWFSLGCIIFKFAEQVSPFGKTRKHDEITSATLEKNPIITRDYSNDFKLFVMRLLCKDPDERAGSERFPIMTDPYLINVNWQDVYNKKHVPPITPDAKAINAEDAGDIGNFNEFELRKIKLTEKDQSKYKHFYYFNEDKWQTEVLDYQFNKLNDDFDKDSSKLMNDFIAFQYKVQEEKCIAYGLLQKKDPFIHLIWSKKVVVLYESYISVANSIHSSDKKFPLTDGFMVSFVKAEDFSFSIHIKGRKINFKAMSKNEYDFWIETLQSHNRYKQLSPVLESENKTAGKFLMGKFGSFIDKF